MSRRTAAWLAWSLCALSLALTTLSLLLLAMNASHPDATIYYFWLETTLVAAGYSTVGAIVASRLPSIPVGWLFCAIGLGFGATHFSAEYATYALLVVPGSLPGGEALAWIQSWLWIPTLGLVVFLVLLFPDGMLPSDRWRWFARITVAAGLAGAILQAFSSQTTLRFGAGQTSLVQNPIGVEGLPDIGLEVQAFMYSLIAVGTASMLLRLRHAGSIQRQQIKWFAYATAVVISGVILKNTLFPMLGEDWIWWTGFILTAVGVVTSPAAMGVAILRYRLYNIDVLINRTLVYGSLTAVLALVYVGSVVVMQYVYRTLTGGESQLAVVASTLVIAALFIPLRRRIQSFIDRRFYRRKYDAAKTLEAFSAKLRDETDLEALENELVGVVRETMQPAHVSLWLRPDKPPEATRQGQRDRH